MRVGIDSYALGAGIGGADSFIRNLVPALVAVDPETEYTLFLTPKQVSVSQDGSGNLRRTIVGPNSLPVRIPVTLPLALARRKIDVLHAEHMAPPLVRARLVLNLHDISWERYPQFFSRADVLKNRLTVPLMARRAAYVMTVSEFSRRDIIARYRVPPERVVVISEAPDPMFQLLADTRCFPAVRERYGTGSRFILSVGNLEPRKNLATLIAAYVRLRRAGVHSHKLVLVGRRAWLFDDIFRAARESGYDQDIVFTGFVPDHDLVALYNAAEVFVFPSLFEGFGLPPLEAMACGTPVIASNTSALPEVLKDAAVLVDPLDVHALTTEIAAMLHDTAQREMYRIRGHEHSQSFSWHRTATRAATTYRMAGGLR